MAQATRSYLDGTGAPRTAITGSNGTSDTTGVTLFDVNGNPLAAALDGTDATGVAAPAGGSGIRGWLSGIYGLLTGTLKVGVQSGSNTIGGVTQAGAPWATTDAANGPVAPGSAAAKAELVASIYNATLPSPTPGQQLALQSDAAGRLITTGTLTSPVVVTVTPAVTVGTYAPKQCLGGLLTFTGALPSLKGSVEEAGLLVANGDVPTVAGTLYLFDAAPTGGGAATDHANAGIASSDMGKLIAALSIVTAADPSGANVPAYGTSAGAASNAARKLVNAGSSTIWGLFVINAATAFAGANDVTFRLKTLSY